MTHFLLKRTGRPEAAVCERGLRMGSPPGPYGLVLSNLVLNSIIHASPHDKHRNISFKARLFGNDAIEIELSDDGCGMNPQIRQQAFDPFITTRRRELQPVLVSARPTRISRPASVTSNECSTLSHRNLVTRSLQIEEAAREPPRFISVVLIGRRALIRRQA